MRRGGLRLRRSYIKPIGPRLRKIRVRAGSGPPFCAARVGGGVNAMSTARPAIVVHDGPESEFQAVDSGFCEGTATNERAGRSMTASEGKQRLYAPTINFGL